MRMMSNGATNLGWRFTSALDVGARHPGGGLASHHRSERIGKDNFAQHHVRLERPGPGSSSTKGDG